MIKSCFTTVRGGGLEPPRPKALEPKSSASANSATRACLVDLPSLHGDRPAEDPRHRCAKSRPPTSLTNRGLSHNARPFVEDH